MKQITIIGTGEIGQAVGSLFPAKSVFFRDINPKKVINQKSLELLIPNSDIVFLCVPSWSVRKTLKTIKPFLKKQFIISLAKGFEVESGSSMDIVLSEFLAKNNFGILGGPTLAEEIMKKLPTVGVLATANKQAFGQISDSIIAKFFHLDFTNDVRGVAVGGVLKNVYSVVLGMADCLKLGYNTRAWLITQIVNEMRLAAKTLGGKTETFLGLAGLGDLIATGSSTDSLHFLTGHKLIKYGKYSLNNEGLISLPVVWQKICKKKSDFPIMNMLYKIVEKKSNAKKIFLEYINYEKRV